jgi:crotonobetainyl-CoA:carnitine CoA-transferase CaiB-like acyl-CoA transferase
MTDAPPLHQGLHRRDYQPDAIGPLDGVRVLDMSRLFAGNVLTQILGDFGAEVIKVEPPAGDTLRGWKTQGVSTHWKIYARNKKSLGLDLRNPQAKDIFLKLVPTAAILACWKRWASAPRCCTRSIPGW